MPIFVEPVSVFFGTNIITVVNDICTLCFIPQSNKQSKEDLNLQEKIQHANMPIMKAFTRPLYTPLLLNPTYNCLWTHCPHFYL